MQDIRYAIPVKGPFNPLQRTKWMPGKWCLNKQGMLQLRASGGHPGRQAIKSWQYLFVTRSLKKKQCILNSNFGMSSQPNSWPPASIPTYKLCPMPRLWLTKIPEAKDVGQGCMWVKPNSKHQSCPNYRSLWVISSQILFTFQGREPNPLCSLQAWCADLGVEISVKSIVWEFAVSSSHLNGYQEWDVKEGTQNQESKASVICVWPVRWCWHYLVSMGNSLFLCRLMYKKGPGKDAWPKVYLLPLSHHRRLAPPELRCPPNISHQQFLSSWVTKLKALLLSHINQDF